MFLTLRHIRIHVGALGPLCQEFLSDEAIDESVGRVDLFTFPSDGLDSIEINNHFQGRGNLILKLYFSVLKCGSCTNSNSTQIVFVYCFNVCEGFGAFYTCATNSS